MFGEIMPSNLTSGKGGIGGTYTDAEFARAIRHGITREGKGIIIMPRSTTTSSVMKIWARSSPT